ncbi:MAG TPA: SGNH/GDSL hydrolase family protein [Steroidobacteraceae bacterium]
MSRRIPSAVVLALTAFGIGSAMQTGAAYSAQSHSDGQWIATWGAAPLPPGVAQGPFPATPGFANQTIRQTVRVSAGGSRIRIRFTNEYGTKPLTIGAAVVALSDEAGKTQSGTEHRVLFSGQPGVKVPAASPFVSDPIDLPVKALSAITISVYFPDDTGPCTCHQTGMQHMFVSDAGDFTDKSFTPKQTLQYRAFISGVEADAGRNGRAVVVLGDSISDGIGSTVDANHRWPDLLANRLNAGSSGPWGVVNMGISGNQVLNDGAGQSALARFDRDVLSVPGARAVVIFEGVNDLGISYGVRPPGGGRPGFAAPAEKVTRESMIAGYRQLIARAHEKGLKVIGATITPYGGAGYYSAEGDAVREAINQWIRTGGEVDGVMDFDAAMRDPAKPTQIKDGFHAGDHLHGSDAGYTAMAAGIDLKLFR